MLKRTLREAGSLTKNFRGASWRTENWMRYAMTNVQKLIEEECDAIKGLLLEKNRKYGNSALEPLRVFSKLDAQAQILARIDDKLSRIRTSGLEGPDEDTVQDLIGYLILLRVARRPGNAKAV